MEVACIWDILFASCISQCFNDIRYSIESLVILSSYHKQPDGPLNAPKIIGGAALTDVLRLQIYMMFCQNPAYHKQPDDPFNAPEIIRGATLTDVLRLHHIMDSHGLCHWYSSWRLEFYVIDTPADVGQCLDSYIIHMLADTGWAKDVRCLDSYIVHTSANFGRADNVRRHHT